MIRHGKFISKKKKYSKEDVVLILEELILQLNTYRNMEIWLIPDDEKSLGFIECVDVVRLFKEYFIEEA